MTESVGRIRVGAPVSAGVVILYLLMVGIIIYATYHATFTSNPIVPEFLITVLFLFLARNVSTYYVLDDHAIYARRLFGSRTIALEQIRAIEFANLRDLGPVSFFGGWGWRGRMWSPLIQTFDAIHTVSPGILVTAGDVPLFVSPKNPEEFAEELSRRARSYNPSVSLSAFSAQRTLG
jgi:PH (Pleckstrin Homology) domain-containing protein